MTYGSTVAGRERTAGGNYSRLIVSCKTRRLICANRQADLGCAAKFFTLLLEENVYGSA